LKVYTVDSGKKILGAQEFLELLSDMDVCISAGGQTLYELARVGVPTVGICVAENQRLNVEACHSQGFVEYVGWDDADLCNRIRKVFGTLNYEKRLQMYEAARRCIDGNGVRRIVGEVLTYAKN